MLDVCMYIFNNFSLKFLYGSLEGNYYQAKKKLDWLVKSKVTTAEQF